MKDVDHNNEARKCLGFLVNWIQKYNGGNKYITYGELAKNINYPEPYIGTIFGNRIGDTLGTMGHLFDDLIIPDWKGRIPYLQALVVAKSSKLPGNGLKEFKTESAINNLGS